MRLRKNCEKPKFIGRLASDGVSGKECMKNIRFEEEINTVTTENLLSVWKKPEKQKVLRRYVVSVDIGGRSNASDYSVITVFDRYWMMELGGVPEKVASWNGHIPHYKLAWLSVQIAVWYNNALLVFESNTYETEQTEGEHFEYVLSEIATAYGNLYFRNSSEVIRDKIPPKWGFHTNKSSKTLIMDNLEKMLDADGYIEKDEYTCDEMTTYEIKPDGSFGAIDGYHDDRLMSTAIGIYVCYDLKYIALPEIVNENKYTPRTRIVSEASF